MEESRVKRNQNHWSSKPEEDPVAGPSEGSIPSLYRRLGESENCTPGQDRADPARNPPDAPHDKAARRFWAKVAFTESCWLWMGGKTRCGYGLFKATPGKNQTTLAHRWSYAQRFGPIPRGLEMDHACRNRACVNPAHLEAVTRAENMRRMVAWRRIANGVQP